MKLYNTLGREVQQFQPLEDNHVKMYTCGLTVYSQPHIGNWVGYIYWDVLVRTLEKLGYSVEWTQNITDVGHLTSDDDSGEDKMEKGAKREGLSAWEIAGKYIEIANHEAYDLLKLKKPTHVVRATEYISQQVQFVQKLENTGYTYEIPGEGIYFDTSKLNNYGEFAKLDIQGLQPGARVSVEGKRNVTDFAVWKFSPKGTKRDMEWDSPWGRGFPGWHLECSAIAIGTLGDQLDIHTGGVDHIPVHHTNEKAQSEALTGKPFSKFWLHNNHLKVDGSKMSKSLGNVYTLSDIRNKGFDILAFKLLILKKHYRTEGNFTFKILEAAQSNLRSLRAMADLKWQAATEKGVTAQNIESVSRSIMESLQNDLNTPEAIASILKIDKLISEKGLDSTAQAGFSEFLQLIDDLFGLELANRTDISDDQKEVIKKRGIARSEKNWEAADNLRGQLQKAGLEIRDTPAGQVWSRIEPA